MKSEEEGDTDKERDCAQDEPPPATKEEGQLREHKELISRVAALNTDLLGLQGKLQHRLAESSLQARRP